MPEISNIYLFLFVQTALKNDRFGNSNCRFEKYFCGQNGTAKSPRGTGKCWIYICEKSWNFNAANFENSKNFERILSLDA